MRLLLLSLLLLPTLLCARIIETRYFSDIFPLVDEETWLVLDIDYTTLQIATALGSPEWYKAKSEKMLQAGMSKTDVDDKLHLIFNQLQTKCPVKPMEPDVIPRLLDLQKRGVVVMALTMREVELADLTFKQVADLGFSFMTTAPSQMTFTYNLKMPILYKNGILFANNYRDKGKVFLSFLQKIGKRPRKVVFVDDKRANVESMNTALEAAGIESISVHYTAKDFRASVYNAEIAAFQEIFLNKVMSNEAALLLMKNHLE